MKKPILFNLIFSLLVFLAQPVLSDESMHETAPMFSAQQVNINTADAEEMASMLDGIGLKKAQAIIAYREAQGEFESIDALALVSGIGAKTIEKNRAALTVGVE